MAGVLQGRVQVVLLDRDKAFEWLERGLTERQVDVIEAKVSSLLHGLDQDPRWLPLLRRLNLSIP